MFNCLDTKAGTGVFGLPGVEDLPVRKVEEGTFKGVLTLIDHEI